MSKVNAKFTVAILLYALLITGIFVAGIMTFASSSRQDDITLFLESDFVEPDPTLPDSELQVPDTEVMIDAGEQYEALSKYADFYHQRMIQKISAVALAFCLFLILSSFGLWLILKKIQKNENIRIANQLNSIQELHEFANDDPVLAKAYIKIQNEFEQHITDYKRLHAYLSHEQKNALSLLRANLELHHEEACLKNIEEITEGIDDLMTLSENPDPSLVQTIDITMVVADVIDKYTPHIEKLTFTFEDDAIFVKAKPRWIICAMNNLIDNAIKYGEGNPIEVSITKEHNQVAIRVQDHGIGIAKEKQEQIFDTNYRVNELNTDGYGIGLSLVLHVCTLCQGSITCQSELGKGTLFEMKLPIRSQC